ncbi:UDP-N-acetylmuramyl-tripeptide synthetase [Agreia sp. COWG]|nr:UDP-N-acetylmuramyl-tripeptide synthetase [Agreia sp. COWG]
MSDRVSQGMRPEHPIARSLSQLAAEFALEHRGEFVPDSVSGISLTSKDVYPGDLYVGLPGRNVHGAAFSRQAAESGAVAVLTDAEGADLAADSGLPVIVTAEPRQALGAVSAWIYRTLENPPTLFGVTGTNGKTSVTYILDAILRQLGIVAGFSTTAERGIGAERIPSTLTTPEATEMHALLARMREAEVRSVIIEVSAQALTRHRIDGIVFDVVGFTNLSHDHLDDYGRMEDYFDAKRVLFEPDRARRGVVLVDGEWGARLADESRIPVTTVSTRSDVAADWSVTILEETVDFTRFRIEGPDHRALVTSIPILGRFMAENAALAIVMLVESGYDLEAIAHALDRDGGIDAFVPGRAERVSGDEGPRVYIDYGHSPDAFSSALESLRRVTDGRVIMVFGADGDRDTTKRAEMASIAARLADVVVITDYNPRFEDPSSIRTVLLDAARLARPDVELYEVADPRLAFRQALSVARQGDVILHAGPGHEDYQEVAGEKIPYSARDEARLALQEHGWL